MSTTATTKPRWVECADKAFAVLEKVGTETHNETKESLLKEASAWKDLAYLYKDSNHGVPASEL